MRQSHGIIRGACLSMALALIGILGSPAPARADLGALVPAYFYPGTGGPGGVGDGWAAMAAAASQIPVTAILNPNSGPLPGPADPNYVNAMTNLENAGGHVVAYVFTNDGNTPLATVESQISTYISQYGSLINGFFLDAMFILPTTLSYYQSLDSYIKTLSTSYAVVGNPGQPFLNGVSPTDYLSTADVFNIFEGSNSSFNDNSIYPDGVTWFQSYPRDRFSNIVYDVPDSATMRADLNRAVGLNAGSVFITDQTLPNPFAQLPSYWNQEVAAIQAANVVPEPGAWTKLASGGLFAVLGMAVQRWRRRRVRA
jgi:hypothetical protein